jgi:uncharacterized integral membrane protein
VRVLYWAMILAAAVFLMLFAVSNRAIVPLALWPLPSWIELPVYLLVIAALIVGFVCGMAAAWIGGHRVRREGRGRRRRIAALERELAAARSRPENRAEGARPALPADS